MTCRLAVIPVAQLTELRLWGGSLPSVVCEARECVHTCGAGCLGQRPGPLTSPCPSRWTPLAWRRPAPRGRELARPRAVRPVRRRVRGPLRDRPIWCGPWGVANAGRPAGTPSTVRGVSCVRVRVCVYVRAHDPGHSSCAARALDLVGPRATGPGSFRVKLPGLHLPECFKLDPSKVGPCLDLSRTLGLMDGEGKGG